MECLQQAIALGVDVLILGFCVKEFCNHNRTITALKEAPQLTLNDDLKKQVASRADKKISYAVIRGSVTPLGVPLKSVMSPSVTCVLQVMKLNEHCYARCMGGFWKEQYKLMHMTANTIPFAISNNNCNVEIIDALGSEILDLDIVYDNYEPSTLSFFDHVFGIVSGVRQRGIQTTEEVLRDGSFITAIGELELDGSSLRLQQSSRGPMFLTTATQNTLIQKLKEARSSMLVKIVILSTVASILIGIIARKLYIKYKEEREHRQIKESIEKSRKETRARNRSGEPNSDLKCVVCITNPPEVIILPCGHACLCESCSSKIKYKCPLCRAKIEKKAAVFL